MKLITALLLTVVAFPVLADRVVNGTYWTPAVAQTTAPRLSAFGHRCCSCPAAAAPLRRPAITPLASLRLAGGYLVVI
jgi:hypothetical protein